MPDLADMAERLAEKRGWQLIETAPKDGTQVMFFGRWKPYESLPGGEDAFAIVQWSTFHSDGDPRKYQWIIGSSSLGGHRVPITNWHVEWTHWRMMPPGPASLPA